MSFPLHHFQISKCQRKYKNKHDLHCCFPHEHILKHNKFVRISRINQPLCPQASTVTATAAQSNGRSTSPATLKATSSATVTPASSSLVVNTHSTPLLQRNPSPSPRATSRFTPTRETQETLLIASSVPTARALLTTTRYVHS